MTEANNNDEYIKILQRIVRAAIQIYRVMHTADQLNVEWPDFMHTIKQEGEQ